MAGNGRGGSNTGGGASISAAAVAVGSVEARFPPPERVCCSLSLSHFGCNFLSFFASRAVFHFFWMTGSGIRCSVITNTFGKLLEGPFFYFIF